MTEPVMVYDCDLGRESPYKPPESMQTTEQQTTEQTAAEPSGKGGPPKGSSNARRHGLRMGALMPGVPHIGRDLNKARSDLEAAVVAARGAVSIVESYTINRIVRFERKLRLAERHLARSADEMAPEVYLAFERESARWLLDRDRALADLELEHRHLDSLWPNMEARGDA